MIRVGNSKSIICSRKELKMLEDVGFYSWYSYYYELPLFDIKPKHKYSYQIETDYVLIRSTDSKLTQSFFDKINKTWNKLYEN